LEFNLEPKIVFLQFPNQPEQPTFPSPQEILQNLARFFAQIAME
jgi:hypothetical protein